MPASRLADRRIREAAHQAALRLDVRGPVSKALAETGLTLLPADATPEAEAPASEAVPTERAPAPRAYSAAAPRVVKPFEAAAWPTRRPAAAEPRALSGLTADERRVHRILMDTLDVTIEQSSGLGGLTAADRKKLGALDLAFIDTQLAGDARRSSVFQTLTVVIGITAAIAAVLFAVTGDGVIAAAVAAGAIALVGQFVTQFTGHSGGATGQRRRILLALRELALLAHADDLASDALTQADLLIDRLADADHASPDARVPHARVRS